MWKAARMLRVANRLDTHLSKLCRCQYKCPSMKLTIFAIGSGMSGAHLSKTCRRKQGVCSAIGAKHYVLSGLSVEGAWRTTAAKVYSTALCRAIARTFEDHWREMHLRKTWQCM